MEIKNDIPGELVAFSIGDENLSSGKYYYWLHKQKIKDCVYRYAWQNPAKVAAWKHKSYLAWKARQEPIKEKQRTENPRPLSFIAVDDETFCRNMNSLTRLYKQIKNGEEVKLQYVSL